VNESPYSATTRQKKVIILRIGQKRRGGKGAGERGLEANYWVKKGEPRGGSGGWQKRKVAGEREGNDACRGSQLPLRKRKQGL